MSVDAVTAQMAATTLTSTTEASGDGVNASQNEAVIASAAEGRRLYIGNLAYATTEAELKEFFKGYLVEATSIPTNPRTTRPVGYAFVDVSTPSEAERAIGELNGKSILERKVSVQLARKPDVPAEVVEGTEGQSRRRPSTRGRGRGRGGRAARAPRGGRDNVNGDVVTDGPTNVPGQVAAAGLTATTNEALTGEPGEEGTITVDPSKTGKPAARPRKQRGPPEDGIPSKTKIMVANLPYDLGEEKLLEIFAEYSPTTAKIALRPIPKFMVRKLQKRNEPRKGRGFGFVTLSSEEMQQKACSDMNGKEIEGREIAVKVAIDSPGKEDEDPNELAEGELAADAPSTAEGSANVNTATA